MGSVAVWQDASWGLAWAEQLTHDRLTLVTAPAHTHTRTHNVKVWRAFLLPAFAVKFLTFDMRIHIHRFVCLCVCVRSLAPNLWQIHRCAYYLRPVKDVALSCTTKVEKQQQKAISGED